MERFYRGVRFNEEETIATKEPQLKGAKASSEQVAPTNGYIDLYLLPVPKKNLAPYRRQATIFGSVAREYGVRVRFGEHGDVAGNLQIPGFAVAESRAAAAAGWILRDLVPRSPRQGLF
jgi:hypothetical protein